MSLVYYPSIPLFLLGTALFGSLFKKDFKQVAFFLLAVFGLYSLYYCAVFQIPGTEYLIYIGYYLIAGIVFSIPLIFLEMIRLKYEWKNKALVKWGSYDYFSNKYQDLTQTKKKVPAASIAFKYWNNSLSKEELLKAVDRSAVTQPSEEEKLQFVPDVAKVIVHINNEHEKSFMFLTSQEELLTVNVDRKCLSSHIVANIFIYPYVFMNSIFRLFALGVQIAFLKHIHSHLQVLEDNTKIAKISAADC